MLNTLVKPNDIIESEPQNILVSHDSKGNVLKITLKLQPYIITCDSKKYFDQTIKVNFEQKHLLGTVIFVMI